MAEPLKLMYSDERMLETGKIIKEYYPAFALKKFLKHFESKTWINAELKARVRLISGALHETLPPVYSEAIDILIPASRKISWGYFGVFFPDYVEHYGLNEWKDSMRALEVFTQTSSGEFAIRPFIIRDEKKAMEQMRKWSKSDNHHVRRLASEGCRPRLPWGIRLHSFVKDPSAILPILETLKNDDSLYVRKSVANNLNDISKDHPDLALKIAKEWAGNSAETDWIIKHALRGLLKKGNKEALSIYGHESAKGLSVAGLKLSTRKVSAKAPLQFAFSVVNETGKIRKARIEYAIDYLKSNGKYSRKIFQVAQKEIKPGDHSFKKSQRFEDLTTRKHYHGEHRIAILVNGEEMIAEKFSLIEI